MRPLWCPLHLLLLDGTLFSFLGLPHLGDHAVAHQAEEKRAAAQREPPPSACHTLPSLRL